MPTAVDKWSEFDLRDSERQRGVAEIAGEREGECSGTDRDDLAVILNGHIPRHSRLEVVIGKAGSKRRRLFPVSAKATVERSLQRVAGESKASARLTPNDDRAIVLKGKRVSAVERVAEVGGCDPVTSECRVGCSLIEANHGEVLRGDAWPAWDTSVVVQSS
jgi:hypothetical protein